MKSTAILFGRYDIPIINLLQAASVILIGAALYREDILHPYGTIALCIVIADYIYQWTQTHKREPQRCFKTFLHNRWVGMMIFAGIFIALL